MTTLKPDQLFQAAQKYCLAGQNKKALLLMNKAIEQDNSKPEYYLVRMVIKKELDDPSWVADKELAKR
jgi:Tfp pilus assembly protein PilF